MRDYDSSWRTRAVEPRSPDIIAAGAQIEAARLRQQRLIASGQLSAAMNLAPNRSLPGYTLVREIHRGGQGVVYLAVQESTGRQVAIKLLIHGPLAHCGATGLARFEREIQVLSRLKHPNIVTIHDCGRDHEQIFLVMDFVPGCSLDAYVSNAEPSVSEMLDLFARVCDGVNAAHLRGVIHRDLKPGNIVVDDRGEPHVLDFGLAKLADDSADAASAHAMTVTGQFVGSLPWASPEQAEGRTEQLDIRTDVYSLGVVLFQLLTGRFPYPVSGRLDEVVRHIVHSTPAVPSDDGRTVDRELETIVLKCLAKDPERRYQSAGELARDIRRYLAGEAIEARRDSLAYVLVKGLARHRVAAITAVIILLALLIALFVSLGFWRHAENQRALAQMSATDAQRSAEHAEREADQARAVTEFMREILTSVDPDNLGADVRLTQVLAKASQSASERFAEHPQQEAAVRDLLGTVFNKLSLWTEAQAEFRRSRELWRDSAGPDDPRTLICDSWYASTALNLRQPDVAESVLRDLLPRMERVLGPDHPTTLGALRDVAVMHLNFGRLDDAERILTDIRTHPAVVNDDRTQIRVLAGLIGVIEYRLMDAERDEHAALLSRAEAMAHEWFERSARLFGPESTLTLGAQLKLAELMCEQGQVRTASEICRRLLDRPYERLGKSHMLRTGAMLTLADALTRLGEASEPAELHLRRLECLRPQFSPDDPSLLGQIGQALPYLDRGQRPVEGEALARELSLALAKFGGGHGDISFDSELYVATFVSMQGRLDEAEPLFQALFAREKQVQDSHARARLHLFYGSQLTRRNRFEEAERELESAVNNVGDIRRGTWDTHPDDMILAYITLYKAWGKPERVEEYQQLRQRVLESRTRPAPD
jgi:tetratricopeptide (TPR) repeat protein